MTLNEALDTLNDDDKIRRIDWPKDQSISMWRVKSEIFKYAMIRPDLINVREDDWEIENDNS